MWLIIWTWARSKQCWSSIKRKDVWEFLTCKYMNYRCYVHCISNNCIFYPICLNWDYCLLLVPWKPVQPVACYLKKRLTPLSYVHCAKKCSDWCGILPWLSNRWEDNWNFWHNLLLYIYIYIYIRMWISIFSTAFFWFFFFFRILFCCGLAGFGFFLSLMAFQSSWVI